jgi:hypothetical protein
MHLSNEAEMSPNALRFFKQKDTTEYADYMCQFNNTRSLQTFRVSGSKFLFSHHFYWPELGPGGGVSKTKRLKSEMHNLPCRPDVSTRNPSNE